MKNKQCYRLSEIRCTSRLQEAPPTAQSITNEKEIIALWKRNVAAAPWFDPCKEHIVLFAVNARYQPQGWNLISIGTLNQSLMSPREIFRPLIFVAAYGFILAHNHPSGSCEPSKSDIRETGLIAVCAELLGFVMLDHIIVGSAGKKILSMRCRFGKQWKRFAEGHLPDEARK
jgi:DNA repair protein RadC